MFLDVCIPKNNEEKFIEIAEKLGTKGLLFLYDKKEKDLDELRKKTKLKIFTGLITIKNPGSKGIYFAQGERKNVENRNIKFLFNFEKLEKKDSFHYKRTGINQVIAKLMKDRDKVMIIDMEKIIFSENSEMLLGRLQQNLIMARKYKFDIAICSFAKNPMHLRAGKDYEALLRSLGFQKEAKESISMLFNILNTKSNL